MRTSEKFPERKHHKYGSHWFSKEERKSWNKPYRQKIKQLIKRRYHAYELMREADEVETPDFNR